jgi:S-adenosylmethionine decarboxylase
MTISPPVPGASLATFSSGLEDLRTEGVRDLAPDIHRQRLVIEGLCLEPISDGQIRDYLTQLSDVCEMTPLIEPVTHRSERYGWAGWVHWETSGAHFYAWETPSLFFSVDIYACKPFDPQLAVEFTRDYFNAPEVVAKTF